MHTNYFECIYKEITNSANFILNWKHAIINFSNKFEWTLIKLYLRKSKPEQTARQTNLSNNYLSYYFEKCLKDKISFIHRLFSQVVRLLRIFV